MKKSLLTSPLLALLLLLAGCGADVDTSANSANDMDNNTNVHESNEAENELVEEENPVESVNHENTENNIQQLNNNNEESAYEEHNEQQADNNEVDNSLEENNDQQTNSEENNHSLEENEGEDTNTVLPTGELEEMAVHFIDVGQADATLFSYSYEGDDFHILYDTGDWNQSHAVNYLTNEGIEELDLVITSHPHADHIGGVDQILEAGITMDEIWMSGDTTTSQTFERVIDAVERHEVDYVEPRTGEEFQAGPLELLVVNPDSLNGDLHDGSVSVRFDYGDVSFLFTGDAEDTAEQRMLQTGLDINVDIFQLGHHGSRTSTTPDFLEAVNPSTAIYSVGSGNSYGHPHQEVVDRVKGAGVDLYGTDIHGNIIVTTDGNGYTVETQQEGTVTAESDNGTNASNETASDSNNAATSSDPSNEEETENNSSESASNTNQTGNDTEEPASSEASEGCVDINTASVEELQRIHQIGPDRAEQITSLRPFTSIQDMTRINGIGEARIAEIKEEGVACVP